VAAAVLEGVEEACAARKGMPEKAYPLLKGEKRRPGFVTILSPICHQISGGIETPPLPAIFH
jgi:hypothetical protein